PIRQVYPDAPEWLIALIGRLHAKHPDERFQSARELAEAALRIQEHLLRYGRVDPQDETLRRLLNPARPASVESLPTDSATLGSASNPASASTSTSTASSALAGLGAIFGAAALGAAVAVGVLIVFNAGPFSRRADENALRIAQMDASGSRGPNASRGAHPSNEKAFPPALGAGTDVGPAGASAPTAPRQAAESAGSELTAAASTSPGGATSVGPETPAAPSPAVVDRRAAEYALSLGCEVTLKFDEGPPATVRELPNVPFSLVGLRLNSRATDEGMAALAGCRNLERVHFVQSPISEQGLSALRDCADLQELYLIGANVGSEATAILAKHKKLARVCVFGCPLDDESLARLKYLPLTELNIGHTLATDATLRAFSGSRVLRNLNASYTTITDAGLAALRECDLTELALDQTAVTDAGLAHFSDCLGLELLSLRGTAVTDAGLAPFIACRSLKRLVTVGTKVTPERLAEFQAALPECVIESEVMRRPSSDPNRLGAEYVFSLAGRVKLVGRSGFVHSLDELPDEPFELSEIWLNQRPVTDTGMAAFRGCKSLTALVLINAPVTNAALANFSECDGLEQLIVSHSRLAPGAFAPFERLDRLTHFIAWSTHLADADFKALAQSPLIELNVGGTPLTDAGLAHLERLDDLSSINARYTSLTFEGAPRFSDCRKIDRLWLDSSHVTDAGLARFQNSPALTILTLDNTPITDAGLAPFKACPLLRRLHVKRTRVSPEMIAEFHKAIPACTIEHDGGVIVGDDPQRRAAEHALALGGAVRLAEMDHELRAPEPLPDGLITLTEVALDSAPTDEAALAPFKKVPSLRKLSVKSTPVSPA
ncbi:MAG TPA: leucine-rich repeat protein, partial [Pirellulales bacterium]